MRQHFNSSSAVFRTAVILAVCLAFFSQSICANAGTSDRYLWKSVPRAQIKIDDKTPLAWNIFQTEKKKEANLVLVLLGRRYIALDIKAKIAYSVSLADLQAKGADFETGDLFLQSRVIPTAKWSLRDVGPAELIVFTMGDYGRTLKIELPHPADLRAFY
jgi:hypothetical protein